MLLSMIRNIREVVRPKAQPLRVFVYGTLKQGHGNFNYICKDKVGTVTKASVPGLIYGGAGFPYSWVPEEHIHAFGTHNYEEDRKLLYSALMNERTPIQTLTIHGELMEFDDPQILKELDGLEGYQPGSNYSHYRRVMVRVDVDGEVVLAWMYVAQKPMYTHQVIKSGVWPREGEELERWHEAERLSYTLGDVEGAMDALTEAAHGWEGIEEEVETTLEFIERKIVAKIEARIQELTEED